MRDANQRSRKITDLESKLDQFPVGFVKYLVEQIDELERKMGKLERRLNDTESLFTDEMETVDFKEPLRT